MSLDEWNDLESPGVGSVTVVDLEGGLDSGSDLVEMVETILGEGERRILLNLRGHSVDSNALGQATRCWLKTNREGGVLKIATRQPKVWDLIRMLQARPRDRLLSQRRRSDRELRGCADLDGKIVENPSASPAGGGRGRRA